jgi:pentapeptide repeat protein
MRRRVELERENVKEQIRAQGLDPERYMPPLPPEEPPPDLDHLDETVERAMALAEEQKLLAEEQRRKAEDDARRQCTEHGLDYDKLVADERKKAGGPPKFSAKAQIKHLHEALEMARNAGVDLPHVEEQLADPDLERKLVAAERQLREAYVKFAHHFPEAASLEVDTSRRLRAAVVAEHNAKESFAGRDFTGADLAGIRLEGADFRGAMLEGVNFADADLRGVDFTGAVLTRANLSAADLTGAKLEGPTSEQRSCVAQRPAEESTSRAPCSPKRISRMPISRVPCSQAPISRRQSSPGPISATPRLRG